jgi:multisubunit Na+/H+ antiporter MnhE subunit
MLGVTLPASYLFWLALVGTFALHELLIGTIAAALTAAGMIVVTLNYPTPFSPSLKDGLAAWRLPWGVVYGTWKIIAVALRDLLGVERAKSLFRSVPFDAGSKGNPRATARRVLAVIYTTITPTTIVLGINTEDRNLLFHEINRNPLPAVIEQLGAKS